jgi:hypothetical protein
MTRRGREEEEEEGTTNNHNSEVCHRATVAVDSVSSFLDCALDCRS